MGARGRWGEDQGAIPLHGALDAVCGPGRGPGTEACLPQATCIFKSMNLCSYVLIEGDSLTIG